MGDVLPSVSADPRVTFLRDTGWFDAEWYSRRCPEAVQSVSPLEHYLEFGAPAGIPPNAWIDALQRDPDVAISATVADGHAVAPRMASDVTMAGTDAALLWDRESALLDASGLFDAAWYLEANPDVAAAGIDPLQHFCATGWSELRKPSVDFDVWWYWATYLDPSRAGINPLVHYALVGKAAGHRMRPAPFAPREGRMLSTDRPVHRICLLAGYDRDGRVDDYVVALTRELARHADVYYLADGFIHDEELDKLAPWTKACWAESHGAYDFGSWSALAKNHVGWDNIARYDELLLVNDSGYLLRPLDDVFAKMDAEACDWWGLQATKGLASTRSNPANQFAEPIPMREVRARFVDGYENDPLYDFHVGSYFLAYRQPVLHDPGFRRLLDSVYPQQDKLAIVQKYEIGLTHYLIGRQYDFRTFIDKLYPLHPLFTQHYFDLVREGYPLLKRYFLSNNHYDIPDLAHWKEWVLDLVPDVDVGMFERNLLRVADDDKLKRGFAITRNGYGEVVVPRLLDADDFARADETTPKFDHWWAFPACAFNDMLAGNERAVFEEVRNDPSIKKIVLTRRKPVKVDGENVVVAPLRSPEGQYHLLRAKQIFVKHSPTRNLVYPVSPELHNIVNLWHGIPLKRIGYASLDMQAVLDALGVEHALCRAVISSSEVDTMAMASAFYPLDYNKVWCTGLPRNDFVLCPFERLPTDLREESARLDDMLEGRRLVLFVPTFRLAQRDAYYQFAADEIAWLHAWLRDNGAVLGVREHMADTSRVYYRQLRGPDVVDLGDRSFPDVEVLYRHAAALVTDYSSSFIDFLLTGRPVVSFAYDYESYADTQRGFFYDMAHVFPGPICRDFDALRQALIGVFEQAGPAAKAEYEWKRRLFFKYFDNANTWRVVKKVKGLYGGADFSSDAARR